MSNMLFVILTLSSLGDILIAAPSRGGWVSGGGDLIRDSQNPWFLHNTKEVEYCIEVDEAKFSAPRKVVEAKVEEALNFWKEDFRKAWTEDAPIKVSIATQDFIYGECKPETPLRFQFGSLTEEQKEGIGDHERYVSLAVRTEYDPKNLRGKGFIYLAPDKGTSRPSRLNGPGEPWKKGGSYVLYWVLVHELGHVFGIPHKAEDPVMQANFPAYIVESGSLGDLVYKRYSFFDHSEEKLGFGGPEYCQTPEYRSVAKFFAFPDDWECYGYLVNAREKNFDVWARKKKGDPEPLFVRISMDQLNMEDVVSLYVTSEQKLIDLKKLNMPTTALNPYSDAEFVAASRPFRTWTAVYKDPAGTVQRPIRIRFLDSFHGLGDVSGILDGRFVKDIFKLRSSNSP